MDPETLLEPRELDQQKMYEKAIRLDPKQFPHVPKDMQTKPMCYQALANVPHLFSFVRPDLLTYDLFEYAIKHKAIAIDYAADHRVFYELSREERFNLWLIALKNSLDDSVEFRIVSKFISIKIWDDDRYFQEFSIPQQKELFLVSMISLLDSPHENHENFAPHLKKLMTMIPESIRPEVFKECMKENWKLIKYLDPEYRTRELDMIALRQNREAINYIDVRENLVPILTKNIKPMLQKYADNVALHELLKARTPESMEAAIKMLHDMNDPTTAKFLEMLQNYKPDLSFLNHVGGKRTRVKRKRVRTYKNIL